MNVTLSRHDEMFARIIALEACVPRWRKKRYLKLLEEARDFVMQMNAQEAHATMENIRQRAGANGARVGVAQ